MKRQLICPGYRSHFDVAWKDQNLVAERSVRRRKKASEKVSLDRLVSQQLVKFSSSTISGYLKEDHEDYAVKFFLSSYILLPKDMEVQQGFLDCLYPVWVQAQPTSPLKMAVASVASYMLEAWSELKPGGTLSLSTSLYLRGIASLRRTLETSGEVGDDVLLGALMLQMYENLRSFSTSRSSNDLHVSGAIALVRHRRRLPFTNEASQRLLLGTRNQIVGRALRSSEAIPPAVIAWANMTPDVTKTPALRLDELNMELANFQAVVSRLDGSTPAQDASTLSLLENAMQLDQRLIAWMTTVPDSWLPIRVSGLECIPQRVRSAGLYQDYCDIYRSIFVADVINSQRCSRIRVHLIILACLEHLDKEDGDTALAISLGVIQELADDICACIPYQLGDRMNIGRLDDKTVEYPHISGVAVPDDHRAAAAAFAGWFVTGRLAELLSPRVPLRDGQRQWIGGQMQRLKRLYAIQPSRAG